MNQDSYKEINNKHGRRSDNNTSQMDVSLSSSSSSSDGSDSVHPVYYLNNDNDTGLSIPQTVLQNHDTAATAGLVVATDDKCDDNDNDGNDSDSVNTDDNDDDTDYDNSEIKSVGTEMRLLLSLALPSIVSQCDWAVPRGLVSSYIGRTYQPVYLDSYMLVMTISGLCTLSLLEGIFDAMDTLMPQAYGYGNYQTLQIVAFRGIIIMILILTPFTIVLACSMDTILQYFGQDYDASVLALQWFRIYCLSLPFYILFHTTSIFLGAQAIVLPEVYVVMVSVFLILPLTLYILEHYTTIGYIGTALSIVLSQAFEIILFWLVMNITQCYHPETWQVIQLSTLQKAIKWKPFCGFISLAVGGMLASSEWIYWEIMSLMIGTHGVTTLAIHTIPTQISTVTYMIYLGCAISLSIRIGNVLPQNSYAAKRLCLYGYVFYCTIFAMIAFGTYIGRDYIIRLFTTDPDVILGCQQIWCNVSIYSFSLGIYAINGGIATGLGKQWMLGMYTILFLFVIGLPIFYYYVVTLNGDIVVAWNCILPPNLALNCTVSIVLLTSNWADIATAVRQREDEEEKVTIALLQEDDFTLDSNNNKKMIIGTEVTYGSI